jgi:hypothetical protein
MDFHLCLPKICTAAKVKGEKYRGQSTMTWKPYSRIYCYLLSSVADSDPGSGAFLNPAGMGKKFS